VNVLNVVVVCCESEWRVFGVWWLCVVSLRFLCRGCFFPVVSLRNEFSSVFMCSGLCCVFVWSCVVVYLYTDT